MRQKYFSRKVEYQGIVFDSKAERDRYITLREMERKGEIRDLRMQVEFELLPKQMKKVVVKLKTKEKVVEKVDEQAVKYHADFTYIDAKTEKIVVEELKSKMTMAVRDYPLRRKLLKLCLKRMNEIAGEEVYEFREIIAK